jgi:hypothetical protein
MPVDADIDRPFIEIVKESFCGHAISSGGLMNDKQIKSMILEIIEFVDADAIKHFLKDSSEDFEAAEDEMDSMVAIARRHMQPSSPQITVDGRSIKDNPQPGDLAVGKSGPNRRVESRDGSTIYYRREECGSTESRLRQCWLSTWREWVK